METSNAVTASANNHVIVEIGGKQHLAYKGLRITCEKQDVEVGQQVTFSNVLLHVNGTTVDVGAPYVNKKVIAQVVKHYRGKKVIIFKKLRRHGYQRKAGHRQNHTVLEVLSVE